MKRIVKVCITLALIITGTIIIFISKDTEDTNLASIEATIKEAEEINNNSSMGMEYLEFANLSPEAMEQFNDNNPGGKTSEDGYVHGYFFKLTSEAKDRQLTQINIEGGDYHVFGIHVGDNIEDASKILEERGYKKVSSKKDSNNKLVTKLKKELVIINLEGDIDSEVISKISILTDN